MSINVVPCMEINKNAEQADQQNASTEQPIEQQYEGGSNQETPDRNSTEKIKNPDGLHETGANKVINEPGSEEDAGQGHKKGTE